MQIQLSKSGKYQGIYSTTVSKQDEDLAQYRWSVLSINRRTPKLYAVTTANSSNAHLLGAKIGETVYLHRLILSRKLHTSYSELDSCTDHKDGDGLNNTRGNIRKASYSENNCNRASTKNNTGVKNIYRTKYGTYLVQVKAQGKTLSASCKTLEDAKVIKGVFLETLHGRFAHD